MASFRIIRPLLQCHSTKKLSHRGLSLTSPAADTVKMNLFNLNFDRRIKVDVNDSIKYMDSDTYKQIYGDKLVWELYRRNNKAQFPSKNTRQNCINQEGFVSTSYPCPVCRDEYLVLHPNNVKLIQQFINPNTGEIIDPRVHSLCRQQLRKLKISIYQAKDTGTLTFTTEDRLYDYADYYGNEVAAELEKAASEQ